MILFLIILSLYLTSPSLSLTSLEEKQVGDLIRFVKHSDPNNLNENLRYLSELLKFKKGNTNHYCCAVETHSVVYENRTRIGTYNVTQTLQVVVGYEPCGIQVDFPFTKPTTTNPFWSIIKTSTKQPYTIPPSVLPTCINKPIYETTEHVLTQYKIETYQVSILINDCPVDHLKCCQGYSMINGECVDDKLIPNIQALIELGLIG